MKEYKIGNNEEGQRLDKLLVKILNQATKGFIYKMLRKKNITLNNKKATGNEILKSDDVVKIFLSDETFDKFSKLDKISNVLNKNVKLNIIAETKDYMIINKPVGMLSQKAKDSDVSLVEYIIAYMLEKGEIDDNQLKTFKPSVCNRLDRNTSGLIIAGKSLIGLQKMTEYIKNRDIDKYYLALVKGKVEKEDKIDGYLVKDSRTNKVRIVNNKIIKENKKGNSVNKQKSDYIRTEYTPVVYNDEYTLLKVKLITGKTHQIRAHLASINHPLIGDYKYGDKKLNDRFKKKYKLESQLLHSYEVIFHNNDEDVLNVKSKVYQAEMDDIFKNVVKSLGLKI